MIGTATPVHRRISLAAGIAYVLTFVSIPTLALYGTVRGASYVGVYVSRLIGELASKEVDLPEDTSGAVAAFRI